MSFIHVTLLASSLLFVSVNKSFGADFYLLMEKCKTTIGALEVNDDNLRVLDGDPVVSECTRKSKTIECILYDKKTEKVINDKVLYHIDIDAPPLLIFSDTEKGDYFAVHQTNHAVTLITRIVSDQFLASKLCVGIYATDTEVKELNMRKQK
jgi:hypothetical protein